MVCTSAFIVLSNIDSSDAASTNGFQYCGSNVTWEFDSATGVLTIKGVPDLMTMMTDFTDGQTPWEENKDSVRSVVIENSVSTIGNNAFSSCTNLTHVSIPKSVTHIGTSAFDGTFYATDGKTVLEPNAANLAGSSFTKTDGKWIQQTPSTPRNPSKHPRTFISFCRSLL